MAGGLLQQRLVSHLALEQPVVLWWRRVSQGALRRIGRRYQESGWLTWLRWNQIDQIEQILRDDPKNQSIAEGPNRNQPLYHALQTVDNKLDSILRYVQTDTTRLERTVVSLAPDRLIFSQVRSRLKSNDLLEVALATTDQTLLLRMFVRVVGVRPGNDVTPERIVCAFLPPVFTAADNTATDQHEPQVAVEQQPSDSAPEIAAVIPVRQPPRIPSIKELLAMSDQAAPAAAAPVEKSGSNRREAFRVNDDLLMSWRQITEEEHKQGVAYFHEKLDVPDTMAAYEQRKMQLRTQLKDWLRRVSTLPDGQRYHRLLANLEQQAFERVMRANLLEEERIIAVVYQSIQDVAEQLIQNAKLLQVKLARVLSGMQSYWSERDKQQRAAALTYVQYDESSALQLEMREALLKGLAELDTIMPSMSPRLRSLFDVISTVIQMEQDRRGRNDRPNSVVITYPVNLSSTGIAFRTRHGKWLEKGALLEIHIALSVDGSSGKMSHCHGKVVLQKGPDANGYYQIACHIILASSLFENMLNSHIVRVQREQLAQRVLLEEAAEAPPKKR
ncbi:MAG: hypothetical protein HQL58_09460 [Magnetococcales bacterium]|nr:hypothetical protein [Magnetococcales bacterium]